MLTTVAAANTYFTTRLGATAWTGANDATKTAALQTAENDLSVYYTLDGTNQKHLNSIYEQALFRLIDLAVDRRAALQAQGVRSAGVVSESYSGDRNGLPPVCGYARGVLGYPGAVAAAGELTRED